MEIAELYRLSRLLRDIALDAIAEVNHPGISAGQLMIIEDIFKHTPTTVGEVTKRTNLSQTLVSKTVQLLHDNHVVTLVQSQTDRRQTTINLDPNATHFIQSRKHTSIQSALEKATPAITPVDRSHLEALLDELVTLFKARKD